MPSYPVSSFKFLSYKPYDSIMQGIRPSWLSFGRFPWETLL